MNVICALHKKTDHFKNDDLKITFLIKTKFDEVGIWGIARLGF